MASVRPATEKVFPPLPQTKDNLQFVISAIKTNNIVALHTTSVCRVFHKLDVVDLDKERVVYVDCNKIPGLLCEDEWDWAIKQAIPDVKELGVGDLRSRIIHQHNIPYREYYGF